MKVLSFLGTGNYSPTLYAWDDRVCTTRFFPVAACAFFEPKELLLATTTGARGKWWAELSTELAQRYPRVRLMEMPIPDGGNEEEIWRIFDALVERFSAGDEVVIDITHGFRSLPVLAVIAAAYLRVAKDVTVHRLLYGAYEARTANGPEGRSPVFDLTPLLTLLEWSAAADLFKRTGNAVPLAALLREIQTRLRRAGAGQAGLPGRLIPAADALGQVSEAMRLVRVHEAMRSADKLLAKLEAARADTAAWVRPFAVLLDQVRDAYQPFALASPEIEPLRDLDVQLETIRWYAEKGWGVEAVALAREWLVSLQAYRMGHDLLADRSLVEEALNEASRQSREKQSTPQDKPRSSPSREIVQQWEKIADLRNDLAHAGMRRDPRSAKSIGDKVRKLYKRLAPLLEEMRALGAGGV
jgi:CRISPR-associated DxTHG motif protein